MPRTRYYDSRTTVLRLSRTWFHENRWPRQVFPPQRAINHQLLSEDRSSYCSGCCRCESFNKRRDFFFSSDTLRHVTARPDVHFSQTGSDDDRQPGDSDVITDCDRKAGQETACGVGRCGGGVILARIKDVHMAEGIRCSCPTN